MLITPRCDYDYNQSLLYDSALCLSVFVLNLCVYGRGFPQKCLMLTFGYVNKSMIRGECVLHSIPFNGLDLCFHFKWWQYFFYGFKACRERIISNIFMCFFLSVCLKFFFVWLFAKLVIWSTIFRKEKKRSYNLVISEIIEISIEKWVTYKFSTKWNNANLLNIDKMCLYFSFIIHPNSSLKFNSTENRIDDCWFGISLSSITAFFFIFFCCYYCCLIWFAEPNFNFNHFESQPEF